MVPIDFDSVDVERVEAENIDVFAFKKVEVEDYIHELLFFDTGT